MIITAMARNKKIVATTHEARFVRPGRCGSFMAELKACFFCDFPEKVTGVRRERVGAKE